MEEYLTYALTVVGLLFLFALMTKSPLVTLRLYFFITMFSIVVEFSLFDVNVWGSHIYVSDLFLLFLFALYFVKKNEVSLNVDLRLSLPLWGMLMMFGVLAAIGYSNDHEYLGIMRDLRPAVHLLSFYPFVMLVRAVETEKIFKEMTVWACLAAMAMLILMGLNVEKAPFVPEWVFRTSSMGADQIEQGYGYSSSYPFYCIAFFWLFISRANGAHGIWLRRTGMLLLLLAAVLTFGRSLVLSFSFTGLLLILCLLITSRSWRSTTWRPDMPFAIILLICGGVLVLRDTAIGTMVLERFSIPEGIAQHPHQPNWEYRFLAFHEAHAATTESGSFFQRLFGNGLGETVPDLHYLRLLNHNSYAWVMAKGGIVFLSTVILALGLILSVNFVALRRIFSAKLLFSMLTIGFLALMNFGTSSLFGSYLVSHASLTAFFLAVCAVEIRERRLGTGGGAGSGR